MTVRPNISFRSQEIRHLEYHMKPAEDPFRLAKRPAQMTPGSLNRRCDHVPVGFGDSDNDGGGEP